MSKTFNDRLNGANDEEAAKLSHQEIVLFLKEIKLYQKLNEVDMPESEVGALAKQSMVLPDYENNPRVANYDDMIQIITNSF